MQAPNIIPTQSLQYAPICDDLLLLINLKILPQTSNEVFPFYGIWLIDLSGSMRDDNKIDAAKESLKNQINNLPEGTIFSLITFGNPVIVHLREIEINENHRKEILDYIEDLTPKGNTPLHEGLKEAFNLLENYKGNLKTKKIILVGDGQPNWGCPTDTTNDPKFKGYMKYTKRARDLGASIDTVGIGKEHNLLLMYQFALQSTGKYIFADDAESLRKKLNIVTEQTAKILFSDPTLIISPNIGSCVLNECIQYKPTTIQYPAEKIGDKWKVWLRSLEAGDTVEILLRINLFPIISQIHPNQPNPVLSINLDFNNNIKKEISINLIYTEDMSKVRPNKNMINAFRRIKSEVDEIEECTVKGDAQGTIRIQKDETQKQ